MRPFNLLKFLLVLTVVVCTAACSKDDDPVVVSLETKTYANLYAPQTGGQGQPVGGEFAKFSFAQNALVTDHSWDIAFRGTTILVNGGTAIGITDEPTRTGSAAASIVTTTLDAVKTLPDGASFQQDGANMYAIPTGSGNGWYNYDTATNLVTPIAGRIFVIKTHDGKYAKFEIVSYYKDAPASPDATAISRHYTLKYVYQPDGNTF